MVRSPAPAVADADLIRLYLNDIGAYPLLTAEEEVSLAKAMSAGAEAGERLANGERLSAAAAARLREVAAAGETARTMFVRSNLRLVVSIARKYQGYGHPLLDLIQEGNLGLLRAVDKFEWQRGFKFSTYATWWIRQGISRGLADRSRTIRLPVHVAEVVNRMNGVEAELQRDLHRRPTDDELANALGIDVARLHAYRAAALDPVSLSAPLGESGDGELHDLLEDETCDVPLDTAVRAQSLVELRALLESLRPRERRILELRFGLDGDEPMTLEQIGREFDLTRERIRQIEAKALAKLRHPSRTDIRDFAD